MAMSEFERLQEEFERKKREIQDGCPHAERSGWVENFWAVGHSLGYCVKHCLRCGITLETKQIDEIPKDELPFTALPNNVRIKILKYAENNNIKDLEDATQKYRNKPN